MVYKPKVIPVILFPGDWCLLCVDPDHGGKTCHMLEMNPQPDGTVAVGPCGCDTSVTAGSPGKYIVRVTQLQKE